MKVLRYLILLCLLGSIVWLYPFLFELFVLGAIGGAYWIFFRDENQQLTDKNLP